MPGKTQTYYNENPDKAADKLKYDTDYQKSGYGRMSNILRKRARRKMEKKGRGRNDFCLCCITVLTTVFYQVLL